MNARLGVRDIIIHNFGTYQVGISQFPNSEKTVSIQLIGPEGMSDSRLVFTISEILSDFFLYLDVVYLIFGTRIASEFSHFITKTLEERSVFLNMQEIPLLKSQYRMYPVIG